MNEYTKEQFTPDMVKNLQVRVDAAWQEYNAKITSQNPDAAKALSRIKSNDSETVIPIEAIHTSTFEILYRNIFVYCGIIKPSFLGSTYTKILRIVDVPKDTYFGDQIVKNFDRLNYIDVASTEFQEPEIHIKDEFDKNVAFEFGTCIVTLHFRRKQ